jgi:hypothetical protein
MTPRQTQIKLFEIAELELEDMTKEFLRNDGKEEELEAGSEIMRKIDELRGLETTKEDLNFNEFDRKYIAALKKDPHLNIKEFLKHG